MWIIGNLWVLNKRLGLKTWDKIRREASIMKLVLLDTEFMICLCDGGFVHSRDRERYRWKKLIRVRSSRDFKATNMCCSGKLTKTKKKKYVVKKVEDYICLLSHALEQSHMAGHQPAS